MAGLSFASSSISGSSSAISSIVALVRGGEGGSVPLDLALALACVGYLISAESSRIKLHDSPTFAFSCFIRSSISTSSAWAVPFDLSALSMI